MNLYLFGNVVHFHSIAFLNCTRDEKQTQKNEKFIFLLV